MTRRHELPRPGTIWSKRRRVREVRSVTHDMVLYAKPDQKVRRITAIAWRKWAHGASCIGEQLPLPL